MSKTHTPKAVGLTAMGAEAAPVNTNNSNSASEAVGLTHGAGLNPPASEMSAQELAAFITPTEARARLAELESEANTLRAVIAEQDGSADLARLAVELTEAAAGLNPAGRREAEAVNADLVAEFRRVAEHIMSDEHWTQAEKYKFISGFVLQDYTRRANDATASTIVDAYTEIYKQFGEPLEHITENEIPRYINTINALIKAGHWEERDIDELACAADCLSEEAAAVAYVVDIFGADRAEYTAYAEKCTRAAEGANDLLRRIEATHGAQGVSTAEAAE